MVTSDPTHHAGDDGVEMNAATEVSTALFTSVDEGLELARVEQDRGDIQAALEVYAAIRKFEPGHSAPYLRAAALLGREGKQHESEQLFADGVRNSPNDVSLSIGYAIVAHQRGDFEEAVRRWSVAHERFPFHEGVLPHYLSTLELTGRHAQAADLRQQLGQQLETRGSAADSRREPRRLSARTPATGSCLPRRQTRRPPACRLTFAGPVVRASADPQNASALGASCQALDVAFKAESPPKKPVGRSCSGASIVKLACMVIGCYAPQILAQVLPVFRAAGWDVFVHVDAKVDLSSYQAALGENAAYCRFVDPVEVYWGGYSMMEAEFRLIRAARNAGAYDKFLLISDDTLPVFPPDWLNAVLWPASRLRYSNSPRSRLKELRCLP